jgi:hypothetical protein
VAHRRGVEGPADGVAGAAGRRVGPTERGESCVAGRVLVGGTTYEKLASLVWLDETEPVKVGQTRALKIKALSDADAAVRLAAARMLRPALEDKIASVQKEKKERRRDVKFSSVSCEMSRRRLAEEGSELLPPVKSALKREMTARASCRKEREPCHWSPSSI